MPQLDISTYIPQLFWLVITFSFFVYVCSKYFIPMIGKIVGDRTKSIAKKTEEAELNKYKASEVLEATNKDYNETIANLDKEKRERKNELFKEFSAKKEELKDAAKDRLKKGIAEVNSDIEAAEKDLNQDIDNIVNTLEDKIIKL